MAQKKYFGTDGVRGHVGEHPITPEFVLKLGWAAGKVLAKDHRQKVLIGKDTRVSGYMFEAALEAGFAAAGVDIRLLGPMPTPAVAYLTRTQRASAGVVISASHNLYQDNGFKFFSTNGYKLPDSVELEIEALIDKPMTAVDSNHLGKAKRVKDAQGRYIEYCKSTVQSDLAFSGLKIVMDCANGATYQVAPSIFRELGAMVILMGAEPDGYNINLDCGSTHLNRISERVVQEGADLGIAFDGDGDRVLMVDEKGKEVDGDTLLFIIFKAMRDYGNFSGGVVGTLMTNMGLEQAFAKMDIPFTRTAVGDRYVLEAMRKKGWKIGGENSGHIICLDYATTGDGIISALQVVSALVLSQQPLSKIVGGFVKFPQVLKNIRVGKPIDVEHDPILQKAIQHAEKSLGNQGRVLVRMSGTEPLLRIMVEAEDKALVDQMIAEIANAVTASKTV
ncbi:MAG: phosphoglucosamine mutase [Gammaproteobacteria bacterium]